MWKIAVNFIDNPLVHGAAMASAAYPVSSLARDYLQGQSESLREYMSDKLDRAINRTQEYQRDFKPGDQAIVGAKKQEGDARKSFRRADLIDSGAKALTNIAAGAVPLYLGWRAYQRQKERLKEEGKQEKRANVRLSDQPLLHGLVAAIPGAYLGHEGPLFAAKSFNDALHNKETDLTEAYNRFPRTLSNLQHLSAAATGMAAGLIAYRRQQERLKKQLLATYGQQKEKEK